jgi:hypothetical protein
LAQQNVDYRRLSLRERRASTLNSVRNDLSAEIAFGEQSMMSGAQDAEIVDRLAATARPRILVMDLNELAGCAALPIAAYERAPQTVSRDELP